MPFLEIVSRNGQITFKIKVNNPNFNITAEGISKRNANLVILAQIHHKLSHGHGKFPSILNQIALECQDQWPPFSITAKSIPGMFGANLVIPAQMCDELSHRQAKFPIILGSKWPKWPWRSRSMTPTVNTKWEYPMMHVWCKFEDSRSNLWWVIKWTSSSWRTDGQTQATTIPLQPERPRVKKIKKI